MKIRKDFCHRLYTIKLWRFIKPQSCFTTESTILGSILLCVINYCNTTAVSTFATLHSLSLSFREEHQDLLAVFASLRVNKADYTLDTCVWLCAARKASFIKQLSSTTTLTLWFRYMFPERGSISCGMWCLAHIATKLVKTAYCVI